MKKRCFLNFIVCSIFFACSASAVYGQGGVPLSQGRPEVEVLRKTAVEAARAGDFSLAVEKISQALKEDAGSAAVLADYLVISAWSGKYQEAVDRYEGLPDKSIVPDYALIEVAKCYRVLARYDRSIALYQDFLSRHGHDKDAVQGLLNAYMDAGQLDTAKGFIDQAMSKDPDNRQWYSLLLADILFKESKYNEAMDIYSGVFWKDPADIHARLGMCMVLMRRQDYAAAARIADDLHNEHPQDYQILLCKGEILEAQGEYMQAYKVYEYVLSLYPGSRIARDQKSYVLLNLGCNSLVRENADKSPEEVSPGVQRILEGNEAMVRIWWQEPGMARTLLKRNIKEMNAYAEAHKAEEYLSPALKRNAYDSVLAVRQQENMYEVIREYQMLKSVNMPVPVWIIVPAADAYLYLRQPEKALRLYQEAIQQGWNPEGSREMSLYYTLVELEDFEEAGMILDELERKLPNQIVSRGVLRDNWNKEEVGYNRGWWFAYQDRLSEADKYLTEFRYLAPFNTHIRNALAQTYLNRGWPRKALQEFEITHTIDPEDTASMIGHAYALYENDRAVEASNMAQWLLKSKPANKHARRLDRYLDIQKKRLLTAAVAFGTEDPGADEVDWSIRIDQPVFPWRNIFAGYVSRDITQEDLKQRLRRILTGLDWRLNRDVWSTAGISLDEDGDNFGYFLGLTVNPDDYWSFSAGYDSYSTAVPARAAVNGVEADEWYLRGRYRASESFMVEANADWKGFSDGNDQVSGGITLDTALTTYDDWKTRAAFSGNVERYSKNDVEYFAPELLYSLYAVPMVEHRWFRRYEREWLDRLYTGIGAQWQKHYSWSPLWYVRYEQSHRFSDVTSLLLGAVYSRHNYDGDDVDRWSIDCTLKQYF